MVAKTRKAAAGHLGSLSLCRNILLLKKMRFSSPDSGRLHSLGWGSFGAISGHFSASSWTPNLAALMPQRSSRWKPVALSVE